MKQWALQGRAGSNWRHSLGLRAGPSIESVVFKPCSAERPKYALQQAVRIEPVRLPLIRPRLLPSTPTALVQSLYALKADVTSTGCITAFSLSLSPYLMVRSATGLPPLRSVRLIFRSTKGDSTKISDIEGHGLEGVVLMHLGGICEDAEEKAAANSEPQDVVKLCEKWRRAHQLERGKDE
jgi:hypothetical protein